MIIKSIYPTVQDVYHGNQSIYPTIQDVSNVNQIIYPTVQDASYVNQSIYPTVQDVSHVNQSIYPTVQDASYVNQSIYRRKVHTTRTFFYPHNSWNKGDAGSVIELKIWDFFPNTSGPIFGFSCNNWRDFPSKMALHLRASTSWVIPSCCWSHLGLTDIGNRT